MIYSIDPLEKLGWLHVKGNIWQKNGRQATYNYAVGYELSKAAEQSAHLTAFGDNWRGRLGEWLVSLGNRIAQSGGR